MIYRGTHLSAIPTINADQLLIRENIQIKIAVFLHISWPLSLDYVKNLLLLQELINLVECQLVIR